MGRSPQYDWALAAELAASGLFTNQIAEVLGCSAAAVRMWSKANGKPVKLEADPRRRDWDLARKLAGEGASLKEIATALNTHSSHVGGWAKLHNVEIIRHVPAEKLRETRSVEDRLRAAFHYDQDSGAVTWTGDSPGGPRMRGRVVNHINSNGYLSVAFGGRLVLAHRLAWFIVTGEWPYLIDHANGIRADNRWANLRECDRTQNAQNQGFPSRNTSGFKGATYHKASGKWAAQIGVKNRSLYLGLYDSPEEAGAAYVAAALKHFGPFHRADAAIAPHLQVRGSGA